MYVSTAYSNAHLKRYSTVHEQLYPLREQGGSEVDHAAIVDRLLAMPVEEAQSEVYTVCHAESSLVHVAAVYCLFGVLNKPISTFQVPALTDPDFIADAHQILALPIVFVICTQPLTVS